MLQCDGNNQIRISDIVDYINSMDKTAVHREDFTTSDGDTTFTVQYPTDSPTVFLNGTLLKQGVDYTTSGATLTLTQPLIDGDELSVFNAVTFPSSVVAPDVIHIPGINDLTNVNTTLYKTVIVDDIDRGGIFVYDASRIADNDGGTVFNGWVRQYSRAVNVKWFGAVGDGSIDDTVAIQKALDITGDIYVSEGVYNVTGLDVHGDTTISGNGKLMLIDNTNKSILSIVEGSSNVYIKDITLDANMENQEVTTEPVRYTSSTIAINSSDTNKTKNIKIDNCKILNSITNGILFFNGCEDVSVTNNIIDKTNWFSGMQLSATNGTSKNFVVSGNIITNVQAAGIVCNYIDGCVVSNNTIMNGDMGVGTHKGDGITGYYYMNNNLVVSDNTIANSGNHGIHVAGINVTVSNNSISDPVLAGIAVGDSSQAKGRLSTNISVTGNTLSKAKVGNGIRMISCSNAAISSNSINGFERGIYIDYYFNDTDTLENYSIATNSIIGANTAVNIRGCNKGNITANTTNTDTAFVIFEGILSSDWLVQGNNSFIGGPTYIMLAEGATEKIIIKNNVRNQGIINFNALSTTSWSENESIPNRTDISNDQKLILSSDTYASSDIIMAVNTTDVTVNTIKPNNCIGRVITIKIHNNIQATFVHDPAKIKLKDSTNKVLSGGDIIRFCCYGNSWYEV